MLVSGDRAQEVLKELNNAVVAGDKDKAIEWAKIVLEEGVDPRAAIDNLANAMVEVGKLFDKRQCFPPDLLMCGDAFYAVRDVLQPHIKETHTKGRLVIGTVEGDTHDLAKNMVKMMLEASGWTVYDLGTDVQANKFAEEVQRVNADVVALSAMTTAIAQAISPTIKKIREQNPDVAIIAGGAPLTRDAAIHFGADGYAESCTKVVEEVAKIVSQKKDI